MVMCLSVPGPSGGFLTRTLAIQDDHLGLQTAFFFNQLRSESFTNEVCIVIPRYSRVQEWHEDSKAWLRNTKALSAEITFTGGKVLVVVSTFFEQVHNYAIALEQG